MVGLEVALNVCGSIQTLFIFLFNKHTFKKNMLHFSPSNIYEIQTYRIKRKRRQKFLNLEKVIGLGGNISTLIRYPDLYKFHVCRMSCNLYSRPFMRYSCRHIQLYSHNRKWIVDFKTKSGDTDLNYIFSYLPCTYKINQNIIIHSKEYSVE